MFTTLKPYLLLARLDKPIGIVLLLFPCWWGVAYVQKSQFSLKLLGLFLIGAIIMRSAGCVLNDLFDQKIDQEVTRTKARPLASGLLQQRSAIIFFCSLCLAGLVVLLQLPPPCWTIGTIGLLLLSVYPLMKRLTNWPQVCLGFAFNVGFLMGVVASTGELNSLYGSSVTLIYLAAILWTIAYDTIYAIQDRVDDIRLGVRSTAVLFGRKVKEITLIFYGISGILMILAVAVQASPTLPPLLIGSIYGWLMYRLWFLDLNDGNACRDFFVANQWLGAGIFVAFLLM